MTTREATEGRLCSWGTPWLAMGMGHQILFASSTFPLAAAHAHSSFPCSTCGVLIPAPSTFLFDGCGHTSILHSKQQILLLKSGRCTVSIFTFIYIYIHFPLCWHKEECPVFNPSVATKAKHYSICVVNL